MHKIIGCQDSRYSTLLANRMVEAKELWLLPDKVFLSQLLVICFRTAVRLLIVCSLSCMASMVFIISGVMFQDHGYRDLL